MTTPTPHGQVPEALIDLIDAYAETRRRCGGIYNARTEAARNAVIEALSGVQALSAAPAVPAGWKAVPVNPTPEMWKAAKTVPDPNPPYPPHYGLVWDAMLAASPTPPAEQQAQQEAQEPSKAYAWVYVNKYGVESIPASKDWCTAMVSGHGGSMFPLYTAPQPAPAPLSEMPYEKRKAIQEGEQISASDAWFHARFNMLDTLDRRNVFRAGFDRGWNAAIAALGGK